MNLEIRRTSRTLLKAPDVVFGEAAKREMRDIREAAEFFDFIEF